MGLIVSKIKCPNTFLQCLDGMEDDGDDDAAFITFRQSTLRQKMSLLQSEYAKTAIQNMSIGSTRTSNRPPSKRKQQAKCSFSNGTSCQRLLGRFLIIDAGIREKSEDLKTQLSKIQGACTKTTTNML